MADREKVIHALQCCREMDNPAGWRVGGCWDCPYEPLQKTDGCTKTLKVDAVELLKEQPAKIKTLHEFQHDEMEGAIVWLETNDDTLYWLCPDPDGHWSGWALHHEDLPDSTKFLTFGVDLPTYLSDNEYGKAWRIWTSKPTAEQMKRSVWIRW